MSKMFHSFTNFYLEFVDTPISLGIYLRLKYNSLTDLPKVGPYDYCICRGKIPVIPIRLYYLNKQCLSLISKSDLDSGLDLKSIAVKEAVRCEEQNFITNSKIRDYRSGLKKPTYLPFWDRISRAQRLISRILGKLDIEDLVSRGSFGPGADLDTVGNHSTVYDKIRTAGSVTNLCSQYLKYLPERLFLTEHLSIWDLHTKLPNVKLVNGNRSATVPKSLKTDRFICVEPRWNVFIQKGIGSHIRGRLKTWGCDLLDQTTNKSLALLGSKTGAFATVDMKSASDTISYELVSLLLPIDWLIFLDNTRSHCTDNLLVNKFSSMGNGFTFELESLIFFALIKSCGSSNGSVYGDDICIEAEVVEDVLGLLDECGFTVNMDKSFTTGFFRESCGGDYFHGQEVTPIYFRAWTSKDDLYSYNRAYDLICSHSGNRLFVPNYLLSFIEKIGPRLPSSPIGSEGKWGPISSNSPRTDKTGREGGRYLVRFRSPIGFKPIDYDSAIIQSLIAPFTDFIVSRRSKEKVKFRKVFVPHRCVEPMIVY